MEVEYRCEKERKLLFWLGQSGREVRCCRLSRESRDDQSRADGVLDEVDVVVVVQLPAAPLVKLHAARSKQRHVDPPFIVASPEIQASKPLQYRISQLQLRMRRGIQGSRDSNDQRVVASHLDLLSTANYRTPVHVIEHGANLDAQEPKPGFERVLQGIEIAKLGVVAPMVRAQRNQQMLCARGQTCGR